MFTGESSVPVADMVLIGVSKCFNGESKFFLNDFESILDLSFTKGFEIFIPDYFRFWRLCILAIMSSLSILTGCGSSVLVGDLSVLVSFLSNMLALFLLNSTLDVVLSFFSFPIYYKAARHIMSSRSVYSLFYYVAGIDPLIRLRLLN